MRLPQVISDGDYVLGCDFHSAIYLREKPLKTEDIKNGIVLRVSRPSGEMP